MSIIVGLHGLPRVGKDTLANHLVEKFGFFRVAFADALYQEVAECFGVTVEELQSNEWKTIPQDRLMTWKAQDPVYRANMKRLGVDVLEPQTSRFHLQRYSTEYKRSINDRYWIDRVLAILQGLPSSQNVVISDVRFPIECGMIAMHAAQTGMQQTIIEILREGAQETGHVSDQHLSDAIGITIENVTDQPEIMFITAAAHIREINGSDI